ncbi:MAG: hypothetical protein WBV25_04045, partial [Methylocella sp.]
MGQPGFFDLSRHEGLGEKNDLLWRSRRWFHSSRSGPKLMAALIKGELRRSDAEHKGLAGRKPWDEVDCILSANIWDRFITVEPEVLEFVFGHILCSLHRRCR